MNATIKESNGRKIFYETKDRLIHRCEGASGPPAVGLLLWTLCEKDVPADTAFTAGKQDADPTVTCPECQRRSR